MKEIIPIGGGDFLIGLKWLFGFLQRNTTTNVGYCWGKWL